MVRRPDLTKNVKDAVVRDYLRGDKTIVIQMEYEISPGEMYRVLHSRQVSLRKAPVKTPPKQPAAEEQLKFALGLLRDDVIKAFTQDLATGRDLQRELKYGISEYDVYIEALCERNDLKSIAKMLYHWIKYLDALPDSQQVSGAKLVLLSLAELCSTIAKMEPED